MMKEAAVVTLNKLMALCSKAEKCELDAFNYMTSHGCSEQEAALGVEYLVENKYVDNRRYAESFFSDKLRFLKWGRKKIVSRLRLKKISPDDINYVLEVFSDVEDEKKIMKDELAKKLRGIKEGLPKRKVWEKLMRFCLSRGYDAGMSSNVIDGLLKDY